MNRFSFRNLLIILICAVLLHPDVASAASGQTIKAPDFRYPQTVISDADKAYAQAEASGDVKMQVMTLIQAEIAHAQVSRHRLPAMLHRVDSLIAYGGLTADYRSLLLLFKAQMISDIGVEDLADSVMLGKVAESADEYRSRLVRELVLQALNPDGSGQMGALLTPVSRYEGILTRGNELGRRCLPCLYDVLMLRGLALTRDGGALPLDSLYTHWFAIHQQDADVLPRLFIEMQDWTQVPTEYVLAFWDDKKSSRLYQKYQQYAESGLLLRSAQNVGYQLCLDYLKRFSRSSFAEVVRSAKATIEAKSVSLRYEGVVQSSDSIRLYATMHNVNRAELSLYRIPDTVANRTEGQVKVSELQLVTTLTIHADGEVPFERDSVYAAFAPQGFGRYIVLPAYQTPSGKHHSTRLYPYEVQHNMLTVSDLRTFGYHVGQSPHHIFVVQSQNGCPVDGAKITIKNRDTSAKQKQIQQVTTNTTGVAVVDQPKGYRYNISLGPDRYFPEQTIWQRYWNPESEAVSEVHEIYTDLAIYRPGETIRASLFACRREGKERQPLKSATLYVQLHDANGNRVEQKQTTTDAFGQAICSFVVPTNRQNGHFYIQASTDSTFRRVNVRGIEVSEYKTPTFYVDLSATSTQQPKGQSATIRGRVLTYSDMPVAESMVECELDARNWWLLYQTTLPRHRFSVRTDAEGNFIYHCPIEWTQPEADSNGRAPFYNYVLTARCTDAAGESQQARVSFFVGAARRLELNCSYNHYCIRPDSALRLPITFFSSDPAEGAVRCRYILSDKRGRCLKQGTFQSDKPYFEWNNVPSGAYTLCAFVEADSALHDQYARADLRLYRESDPLPPVESAMWMPDASRRVSADGKAHVLVGCSCESWIYYVAQSRQQSQPLSEGWLHYQPGMHHFELDMPAGFDERLDISFFNCCQGDVQEQRVFFESPRKQMVKIQAISFRDHVLSGTREHWRLQLTDQDGTPVVGRMMLQLYSQALEQLQSNRWTFNNASWVADRIISQVPFIKYFVSPFLAYRQNQNVKSDFSAEMPSLNLYNQRLAYYSGYHTLKYNVPMSGKVMRSKAANTLAVEEVEIVDLSADEEAAIMVGYACAEPAPTNSKWVARGKAGSDADFDQVQMREGEVKVALWQPQLTADEHGQLYLDFDVPNFNTTWCLQALAIDSLWGHGLWSTTVLAQRPLMVQSALPRFLRVGDQTELKANIRNAADSAITTQVLIEIFDPRTQQIIRSERQTLVVGPKATQVVGMLCTAPYDTPYLGFRVKALSADGSGDGEQQMLPVLTNISPVCEAAPFYLHPADEHWSADVRKAFPQAHQGTLAFEYCHNPAWYCVKALSAVTDAETTTSIGVAHQLYALALSDYLAPDSTGQRAFAATHAIGQLLRFVRPDGGLSWLEPSDMSEWTRTSSYWATSQVLQLMGELQHIGCLPADTSLVRLMEHAVGYLDCEVLDLERRLLKNAGRTPSPTLYLAFADYEYVRQLFDGSVPCRSDQQTALRKLRTKTLDVMAKHWGDQTFTIQAYMAMSLYRAGRKSDAQHIVESLRQHAISTPHTGMYWERVGRGTWQHPVACTARILQAFVEVDAREAEIDQIRQWLLLEKQTSDWGGSSMVAEAVYALVSTGTDWLHPSEGSSAFGLMVDGQRVDLQPADSVLGYVRVDLPADARQVELRRTGNHPAWGALHRQYRAPMTKVKPQQVDDLSIRKEILVQDSATGQWRYVGLAEGTPASQGRWLKVGDKVQVRFTIVCHKDLEYLTLTDERPAFLEPIMQTSGYRWGSGMAYYEDMKDSSTRLYFHRLAEGKHTVSYECTVTHSGSFAVGIATIQSQYAPQFVAHSGGLYVKF